MKIATARKHATTGHYSFQVKLPFLAPVIIDMEAVESANDRAPDFNLFFEGEKCGALWKRNSQGGESFLSGPIETPVIPGGRLEIAIFKSKSDPGTLEMTWRPPLPGRSGASEPGSTTAPAQSAPATGDDDHPPF
jgi:uncharacterized protein (DUF736 family)